MQTIVTYDALFEILRSEKNEPSLQNIPESFLADVCIYFTKKQEILAKAQKNATLFSSDQSDSILQEIRNAKKVLAEIFNRRERKIITLAQHVARTQIQQHDVSTMLPLEKELFLAVIDRLSMHREQMLTEMTQLKEKSEQAAVAEKKFTVMSDISEFIGPDLEKYGPFKVGDVAAIPEMVATILLERGQIRDAVLRTV